MHRFIDGEAELPRNALLQVSSTFSVDVAGDEL